MKVLDKTKEKIIDQLYQKSKSELWKVFCNLTEEEKKETIYKLMKAFYAKNIDMEDDEEYYWMIFSNLTTEMQKAYITSFGYQYEILLKDIEKQ